jgi:hypothetical protein
MRWRTQVGTPDNQQKRPQPSHERQMHCLHSTRDTGRFRAMRIARHCQLVAMLGAIDGNPPGDQTPSTGYTAQTRAVPRNNRFRSNRQPVIVAMRTGTGCACRASGLAPFSCSVAGNALHVGPFGDGRNMHIV